MTQPPPDPQDRTKQVYTLQWNRYRIVRSEEDLATFRLRTGLEPENLAGTIVLDAGCGMGRYLRVAAAQGPARLVGMDISWSLQAAKELACGLPNTQFVRGDLLRIPLAQQSFDHIYSLGVLDHTPDPRRAFLNLAKLLRPGGRLVVWVYRKERPLLEAVIDIHRGAARFLPLGALLFLSRVTSPIGALKRRMMAHRFWLIRKLGVLLNLLTIGVSMHPDPEVRVCDTLDWYAPRYASRHTEAELRQWFQEAGLIDVLDPSVGQPLFHAGQGNGVNLAGRRPPAHASTD